MKRPSRPPPSAPAAPTTPKARGARHRHLGPGTGGQTTGIRIEGPAANGNRVVGNTVGQDQRSALRLVTCGGSFDESSGHCRDNVIVHAKAL